MLVLILSFQQQVEKMERDPNISKSFQIMIIRCWHIWFGYTTMIAAKLCKNAWLVNVD